jgi:hypothetical protein
MVPFVNVFLRLFLVTRNEFTYKTVGKVELPRKSSILNFMILAKF